MIWYFQFQTYVICSWIVWIWSLSPSNYARPDHAPIVVVIQSEHLKHSISPERQSAKHKDSGCFGIKRGCNWLGAMKGIALWSRGFSRGSLKTWPKPETAHEKPLAPRVRFSVIEEVELSNTRTAYVIHIPNTLSLTSKRNNRKQKFLQSTSF